MGVKERRAREKEARRNQILDAARVLLFQNGLAGASVNRIAKKAEIGTGTIYFYFKSKEDIFAALQMEGLEILYQIILNSFTDKDTPADRLKSIAMGYYRFSREHKNYFDVINYFLTSPETVFSKDQKQEIDGTGGINLDFLADTIRDGNGKGGFTCEDPQKYAIMFWATLHGLINLRKLKTTVLADQDLESLYMYSVNQLISAITL